MGKGKPRHNPRKQRNKWCDCAESIPGGERCELGITGTINGKLTCGGLRHNCMKARLIKVAGSITKKKFGKEQEKNPTSFIVINN